MQYAEHVVLTPHGVRIPLNSLAKIGVGTNTQCWGVWLHDWPLNNKSQLGSLFPAHFLLSPFEPTQWACLLDISLKLDDKRGAVKLATDALANARVNVLSHHFTPSGHHHGTLRLIGTTPSVLMNNVIQLINVTDPISRKFDNITFRSGLCHQFAQCVLDVIHTIELSIL